jgi:hypothetical protein
LSNNENEATEVPHGEFDDGGYGNGYVTPEENEKIRAEMEADIKALQESQEDRLPEAREVILPVNMKQGPEYVQLGDAIYDAETQSLVVKFNTKAGRDISNLIGSGVLSGILFGGQMSAAKLKKN